MNQFTAILNSKNEPLFPTNNFGLVRKLLKNNEGKIIKRDPLLTIQLLNDKYVSNFINQNSTLSLGIDVGSSKVGFSVISTHLDIHSNFEIIGGELELRNDITDLITDKAMYRRNRRGKKTRYREVRFDNRKNKKEGWLPPSVQHKLNSHLNLIKKITTILPINNIILETADFDIQKIKNPEIKNEEYQKGDTFGFGNVRQYVLARDGYKCQLCQTSEAAPEHYKKNLIYQTHHIIPESKGGTNKPDNFLTLCTDCHSNSNHASGQILHRMYLDADKGKFPKFKQYKHETFMSIIAENLLQQTIKNYPTINVKKTLGYVTKNRRIVDQDRNSVKKSITKIDKTHRTDAFYIAGGSIKTHEPSLTQTNIKIIRRNNRRLDTWHDATYVDNRTGEVVKGFALSNGRKTRNKNISSENLRKYRGKKLTKGKIAHRDQRYSIQNGDYLKIIKDWSNKKKTFSVKNGEIFKSGGTFDYGKRIYHPNGRIPSKICQPIRSTKGFSYTTTNDTIKPKLLINES
jgi:hypothetical protein